MPTLQNIMNTLLVLGFSLLLFSCGGNSSQNTKTNQGNSQIQIKGKFQSLQKGWVVLKKVESRGYKHIDSVEIQGQEFTIKVNVPEPEFYLLSVSGKQDIPLVLNKEDISLAIDTRQAQLVYKVEGSQDTKYYEQLEEIYQDYKNQVTALRKENVDNPEQEMQSMQNAYLKIQRESVRKVKKFIDEMKPSIVIHRAASLLDMQEENAYLNELAKRLNKEMPNSIYTKQFAQRLSEANQLLEATKHLAIGQPAPEMTLETPQGQLVKLSSLKGKVVLIDFWASWCKPCRMENPQVVKMYEKYKNKGFEIYGVSIDQDREAWLKAISDDGLPWIQVADNQASEAAKTYFIQAIPATFLLDKEGIITEKNLRGVDLEQKVAELLN